MLSTLYSAGTILMALVVTSISASKIAEQKFHETRVRFDAEPTNALVAVAFARAAFDWAEFATSDRQREALANEGIAASRQALRLKPDYGPAHYYLALNLGQYARTKRFKALGAINEMEKSLLRAIELDPAFSHAGPDRTLGLLYLQAPGWPISVGNRAKAERHLTRAVAVAPEYPENHLALIEAWLHWKNGPAARRQAKALADIWPKARERFKGPEWEDDWKSWTEDWSEVRAKIGVDDP